MKKSLFLLFILFPFIVFSQQIPINKETGKVEYTAVIDAEGTKDELISRAKSWISTTFNSPQDIIHDKQEGYLIVKGLSLIDYAIPNTSNNIEVPMHFTLMLDFKDNKYRYRFTDIYFKSNNEDLTTTIAMEQTLLNRSDQQKIVAEHLNATGLDPSTKEFQDALDVAFNKYDQFKSKGHWTIIGISQLLKQGMSSSL